MSLHAINILSGLLESLQSYERSLSVIGFYDIPRVSVVPQVGGSDRQAFEFGDGAVEMSYLRYVVNADNDTDAGTKLLSGGLDVGMLRFNSERALSFRAPITRLDVVAASVDEPGTPGTGVPMALNPAKARATESSEANVRTSMVTFTFDASDAVRSLLLTLSDLYADAASPSATAQWAMLHVEAFSHA